jgi:hypothetical protein
MYCISFQCLVTEVDLQGHKGGECSVLYCMALISELDSKARTSKCSGKFNFKSDYLGDAFLKV